MNSIKSILAGLLSSLLLSLGFSRMAARFDHLDQATPSNTFELGAKHSASVACTYPCRWQEV